MIRLSKHRGFTLIELLVVIAIIGVLAAVILAALGSARAKAADSSIKSNIHSSRVQAQLFYDNAGASSFDGLCLDPKVVSFVTGATTAGSAVVNCADDVGGWALEAQLKTSTNFYCVDSAGNTAVNATSTIAEGSDYTCG